LSARRLRLLGQQILGEQIHDRQGLEFAQITDLVIDIESGEVVFLIAQIALKSGSRQAEAQPQPRSETREVIFPIEFFEIDLSQGGDGWRLKFDLSKIFVALQRGDFDLNRDPLPNFSDLQFEAQLLAPLNTFLNTRESKRKNTSRQ